MGLPKKAKCLEKSQYGNPKPCVWSAGGPADRGRRRNFGKFSLFSLRKLVIFRHLVEENPLCGDAGGPDRDRRRKF